jgi:NAD(P)-dependent dehydrogenase (short-subunit alcohol dehydrogenase family)
MPTVLITGAGRGLGLEFVRQYAADGWRVLACARDPGAAGLVEIAAKSEGRVTTHALDVGDHTAIEALAGELDGTAIDVLLNVAGTMGADSFASKGMGAQRFGRSDYDDWLQTFRVNVFGPMKMAEAFLPHVAASAGKTIVTLTSVVGSMASNLIGGLYAYRSSKAAANAVMKSMSVDLKRHGIIALPMHPGWAKTDMGGPKAPVEPVESVAGMRRVIAALAPEDAGRFLQYDGTELPW